MVRIIDGQFVCRMDSLGVRFRWRQARIPIHRSAFLNSRRSRIHSKFEIRNSMPRTRNIFDGALGDASQSPLALKEEGKPKG